MIYIEILIPFICLKASIFENYTIFKTNIINHNQSNSALRYTKSGREDFFDNFIGNFWTICGLIYPRICWLCFISFLGFLVNFKALTFNRLSRLSIKLLWIWRLFFSFKRFCSDLQEWSRIFLSFLETLFVSL